MMETEQTERRKIVRVYKQSELRAMERGFAAAVQPIHSDIDTTFASVEGVACKSGCSHCCHLRVEVLPPEAARMVDYVRANFTAPVRQRILDRLKSNAELEKLSPHEYRAANAPCAFLGDNGLCMVYDQRPITCRGFGSTDVDICALTKQDDGQTTFSAAPQSLMVLIATSGLFWSGLHQSCLDYWMGMPIEVEVSPEDIQTVVATREAIERAAQERRKRPLARPAG